jgi:hypothetical protein
MLRPVRGDHCRTVHPQNYLNIMQFVPIYMDKFSAHIVLNLFYVYQSFQFYLLSNLFCFDQTFQSLSHLQTFKNFRRGIALWIYALGSTFSQKICNLIIKQRAHTKNMEIKNDLCFGYSTVIENDFQCWLTVHIIWRRLWCAASTFNLWSIDQYLFSTYWQLLTCMVLVNS